MYKICGICKKSILLNNENFRKDKHQKDGYHWACKKCLSLKEVKRKIQKLSVYDKGLKFQKYYIYYQTKFTKNDLLYVFDCNLDEYEYALDYFDLRHNLDDELRCSKCLQWKVKDEFAVDKSRKTTGRKNWCKQCCNEHKHRPTVKKQTKITNQNYYLNNKDKINQKNSDYYQKHVYEHTARVRYYKLLRKKATPKWANFDAIMDIYKQAKKLTQKTGILHEVDHIIPLQNHLVCGLHVENNLQILTREQNRKKFNHFEPIIK